MFQHHLLKTILSPLNCLCSFVNDMLTNLCGSLFPGSFFCYNGLFIYSFMHTTLSFFTYLFIYLSIYLSIYLFIYFWLCWVFVAARGLSVIAASGATLHCGAQASPHGGLSCCRAWALGTWASVVVAHGLSSCGSQALQHKLSSCGAQA